MSKPKITHEQEQFLDDFLNAPHHPIFWRPDMTVKETLKRFKVGEKVRVYSLMNPLEDYIGDRTISAVEPMYPGGETMLWFEEGGGAWHPDACTSNSPQTSGDQT